MCVWTVGEGTKQHAGDVGDARRIKIGDFSLGSIIPVTMEGELKQKILKYADAAFAAAYQTSLLKTQQEIRATINQLACRDVT